MKRLRQTRMRLLAALWVGATIVMLCAPAVSASDGGGKSGLPAVVGWPGSMASTGDSITRAFNSGSAFVDAPANSWSTGTNATVNSHYSRILAANPAIAGHTNNDAVTGAKMADLNAQIANVNSQNVEYVTVLLGANDACTDTEALMTPVATFRAQFQAALNTLAAGSPDARVYVLSVPNIYNLWSVLHNNGSARFAWALFGICESMFANPTSTAQADVDRRDRVRQRVIDYNTQIAEVCAAYIHCRFDNNTVFNTEFVPSDISTRDYFHPSIAGQTKLAAFTYPAGFDFTDATPPTSTFLPAQSPTNSVLLQAQDNVGVRGIEYRIDAGPWTRYADSPVTIPAGSTLSYRAVDVNGNVEASHTATLLVGHVTWQGRPPQPDPLQQVPVSLTLTSGLDVVAYPTQTTDASGTFTVPVGGGASSTYDWVAKGPQHLSNSGSVVLTGPVTNAEMGLMRAGDANGDNTVEISDFSILKATFGRSVGDPDYDGSADFTGDGTVDVFDFNWLKINFGQGGGP